RRSSDLERWMPATGPAMIWENSSTRMPRSGPPLCGSGASATREAQAARSDDVALHLRGPAPDGGGDGTDVGVRVVAGAGAVRPAVGTQAKGVRGRQRQPLAKFAGEQLARGRLVVGDLAAVLHGDDPEGELEHHLRL